MNETNMGPAPWSFRPTDLAPVLTVYDQTVLDSHSLEGRKLFNVRFWFSITIIINTSNHFNFTESLLHAQALGQLPYSITSFNPYNSIILS